MERYLFMRRVLERLADARFCGRATATVLRVMAVILVLYNLVTFFSVGKLTFTLPANGILGGVLFELFLALALYATVHVLALRAAEIERLESHEVFALPLGAKLVQLLGEAYAAFVSLVAIGGGLFVWFTNLGLSKIVNPLMRALFPGGRDDPSFMGGIAFLVTGILAALGVLVLSYILAQLLTLTARSVRASGSVALARPMAEQSEGFRSRFG